MGPNTSPVCPTHPGLEVVLREGGFRPPIVGTRHLRGRILLVPRTAAEHLVGPSSATRYTVG